MLEPTQVEMQPPLPLPAAAAAISRPATRGASYLIISHFSYADFRQGWRVLQRLGEQSSLSHTDCLTVFTATTFLAGCLMTALHAPVQPNAFFQFPPMGVLQDSTTSPCFGLYSLSFGCVSWVVMIAGGPILAAGPPSRSPTAPSRSPTRSRTTGDPNQGGLDYDEGDSIWLPSLTGTPFWHSTLFCFIHVQGQLAN